MKRFELITFKQLRCKASGLFMCQLIKETKQFKTRSWKQDSATYLQFIKLVIFFRPVENNSFTCITYLKKVLQMYFWKAEKCDPA